MVGDVIMGVQIQQMEVGLDIGLILLFELVFIKFDDIVVSLYDCLMEVGVLMWLCILLVFECGLFEVVLQMDDGVIYVYKILLEEVCIDWLCSVVEFVNYICGLLFFFGVWFQLLGDKGLVCVKVLMVMVVEGVGELGVVLDDMLIIVCGEGVVCLVKLQCEGKGVMMVEDFLCGIIVLVGMVLG